MQNEKAVIHISFDIVTEWTWDELKENHQKIGFEWSVNSYKNLFEELLTMHFESEHERIANLTATEKNHPHICPTSP